MLTIRYDGPERTINHRVWYSGETRTATPEQLAAMQAEHGDVFVMLADKSDGAVAGETPGEAAAPAAPDTREGVVAHSLKGRRK